MNSLSLKVLACSLVIMGAGCASSPPPRDQVLQESDLEIEKFSDGEAAYVGLYNAFIYRATLHNATVRSALLGKQKDYYQWDREKFLGERDKSERQAAADTKVFLSFYTPDRRNDNLADAKSIWRVYLEVGDKRFEGKLTKVRLSLAELQALYAYHTRFNTPYEASFTVPTALVESQSAKLTVTGPLGTKSVTFGQIR